MRTTTRVPIRELQRHASELVDRVGRGETVEITRNGRLVAVLAAPEPADRVLDHLVSEGLVDPDRLAGLDPTRDPLAGWQVGSGPEGRSLDRALAELREDEER